MSHKDRVSILATRPYGRNGHACIKIATCVATELRGAIVANWRG